MQKDLSERAILTVLSMVDSARTTLNCVRWLLSVHMTEMKQPEFGKVGTAIHLVGPEWTDNWGRPFQRHTKWKIPKDQPQ